MTAHAAIAAVPKTGTPQRTMLQALLVSRVAWIVGSGENPADFDPRGEDGSPVTRVIGYNGLWFWYDEADSTTGHDGTTCIVTTATGGRYKVTGVDILITSVISKTLTTPPDPDDVDEEARPSDGDAYIVPTASTGPWATWTGSIAVWVEARREWFRILPKAGWFVSVPAATRDVVYRYDSVQAAWITGDGSTPAANTVPLSALIAHGLGPVRVSNQTTYAPPGSRKTGATPAMALGGTASNINDNSDSTTAVTSALGDLSAAAFASRIVAQLTLAATTDLICIEVRAVLGSAAGAMGIWYKSGGVWSQAGSGFTLSTSAQNIQRTGDFQDVTDIALVTEAKNWSTNTHTLAGLNAYDATVTGSVGDALIIAAGAFGIFAGHEGKVAICQVADTYTIYTPAVGNKVYDIALGYEVRWSGAAWVSAAGAMLKSKIQYTQGSGSPSGADGTASSYPDHATAPTTATERKLDPTSCTYTALTAGNVLIVNYEADFALDGSNGDPFMGVLYRGNETTALAWSRFARVGTGAVYRFVFYITAVDAAEQTYKFAIQRIASSPAAITAFGHRLWKIEEYAP